MGDYCRCPTNPPKKSRKRAASEAIDDDEIPPNPGKRGDRKRIKIDNPQQILDEGELPIPYTKVLKLPAINPRVIIDDEVEPRHVVIDQGPVNSRQKFDASVASRIWQYLRGKSGNDIVRLADVVMDYLTVVKELRKDAVFKKVGADASRFRKAGYNYRLALLNALIEHKDRIF